MPLRNDPFQRLTLCGVLQRALEVYRAEPTTFLSIGVIWVLPNLFMNWLLLARFADIFSFDDKSDPEEVNKKIFDTAGDLIGPLLVFLVFLSLALS